MKKDNFFLKGILALMLVFTLVLTACSDGDEDGKKEETTVINNETDINNMNNVSLSPISNPVVTARVVFDGVILTWSPIIEADGYAVWRSGGGQDAPILLSSGSTWTKQANGLYEYYDKDGSGNVVKRNTQYTYTVLSLPYSPVNGIGKWEGNITTDPPLFGSGTMLSVSGTIDPSSDLILNSTGTVIGYYATIDLSKLYQQRDVIYTIERATLDANDTPGTYTTVSLSKMPNNDTPIGNLTPDIFGNFAFTLTSVYDRGLPPSEGKYLYRIKGVKENTIEYIYCSTMVTINLNDYLIERISLTIDAYETSSSGNFVYKITPNFTGKKGMLQDDDKVVLYWLIGDKIDCYKYGPYAYGNSVTFTKPNLESMLGGASADFQNLTVPANTSNYLYVQAWLERSNEDKIALGTSSNWAGSGKTGSLISGINGQWHLQLQY